MNPRSLINRLLEAVSKRISIFPHGIRTLVGVCLLTAMLLLSPKFFGGPRLVLEASRFSFEATPGFGEIRMVFQTPLREESAAARAIDSKGDGSPLVALPYPTDPTTTIAFDESLVAEPTAAKYAFDVRYSGGRHAELTAMYLSGKSVPLDAASAIFSNKSAELLTVRDVRSDVVAILDRYNEGASNILLAGMAVVALLTSFTLIQTLIAVAVISVRRKAEPRSEETRLRWASEHIRTTRMCNLMAVLGPATGFLLTTSSLVVSLDPEVQASQNMGEFFGSIRIALVATFLGLFIRIAAILTQRLAEIKVRQREVSH